MIKINARDCDIVSIDKKTEREFLDNNHTNGFVKGSIVSYGLKFEDELVQLISLGKPRYNKNYQWELLRDCTKKDYIVRGGVSKLWKYFLLNNTCRSCICYSYEHNSKPVEKYIKYCKFRNIRNSKIVNKSFYEGSYNNKNYSIPINNLRKYGVDRILGTQLGFDHGTNEEILFNLGFEKVDKPVKDPQVDIYYPFSVVYRTDDLTDESFYIGMCESKKKWDKGYLGSGTLWSRHIDCHKDHKYVREIIKQGFNTPKDCREFEQNEIKKAIGNRYNKNLSDKIQGGYTATEICPECGGKNGQHYMTCSKANVCKECGRANGFHKMNCSKFNDKLLCSECGGLDGKHKSGCSKYKEKSICEECGGKNGHHKKGCSLWIKPKICNECGGSISSHKKWCSQYNKKDNVCPECGAIQGHKKNCSKYKEPKRCPECGGIGNNHKANCSKFNKQIVCEECGNQVTRHKSWCSHYKSPKPCPECGGLFGHHKKNCSKISKCEECGGLGGHHYKTCSKYKRNKQL